MLSLSDKIGILSHDTSRRAPLLQGLEDRGVVGAAAAVAEQGDDREAGDHRGAGTVEETQVAHGLGREQVGRSDCRASSGRRRRCK